MSQTDSPAPTIPGQRVASNSQLREALKATGWARANVFRKGEFVGFLIARPHQGHYNTTFYACGVNAGMRKAKFRFIYLDEELETSDCVPKYAQPCELAAWKSEPNIGAKP